MSNPYIKYLSSLNNANSDNQNTLAESQVQSEYYKKIAIDREIGKKICALLKNDKESIILTGHAGDGKTSILVQILNKFGYFSEDRNYLKVHDEFNSLFYIKDMSESNSDVQEELLLKFLMSKNNEKAAIMITNTGPLISTFKRITAKEQSSEAIESSLLNGIEKVISDPIEVKVDSIAYRFRLVNIANIDNSFFSSLILDKLLTKELWSNCDECDNGFRCPIYMNFTELSNNREVVKERLSRIYYEMSQNGKRLTIRQMFSHISYSITSNLKCSEIKVKADNASIKFKYSFANRLFGCDNKGSLAEAYNIVAIKNLSQFNQDQKSLGIIDNKLFVKKDFSMFSEATRDMLLEITKEYQSKMEIGSKEGMYYRRSIRRHLIMLGQLNDEDLKVVRNRLYTFSFNEYYSAVQSDSLPRVIKNQMENVIFKGLYRLFVGVHPTREEDKLQITLRKSFFDNQNAQLLMAKIDKSDIKLHHGSVDANEDKSNIKSKMKITFGSKCEFPLDYEFYDFLYRVSEGEVFTSLHPSFTFGLNKLKTTLIRHFKVKSDEIVLLVNENNSIRKIRLSIEDSKIYVG